jgi:hypothetical protein
MSRYAYLMLIGAVEFLHRWPVDAQSGKPQNAVEELAKLQEEEHVARVSGNKTQGVAQIS